MAIIPVPKTPKSAFNKSRPVSGLLKAHLEHLQRAEFRLPAKMQTNIYINAIKSEGEAADYIRLVTKRLHAAHGHEIATKPKRKAGRVAAIAAAAGRAKSRGQAAAKAKGGRKRKR